MTIPRYVLLLFAAAFSIAAVAPYPLDGYEHSGIRRLLRTKALADGELQGRRPPAGAMKSVNEITLNLRTANSDGMKSWPQADPVLQASLDQIFARRDASYSIALMDITPGKDARLAMRKPDVKYQPGSVGKLAILAGLFTELNRIYPGDIEARRNLLATRMVTAGPWVRPNHHTIPVYDPKTRRYASRAVLESDVFSLFEWADHAISASSNAAASVVWKEAVLMRAFGKDYPPSPQDEDAYFANTPKRELGDLAVSVVNDPLRAIGIEEEQWRLGLLFTTYAGRLLPASGGSWGTVSGLLKFLVKVEEGGIVDEWSSLEIKRLMYQTERRIRYAAASSLADAAVYFKSGSLYKCDRSKDADCGKYRGNVYNYMNSVAIVETADGRVYLVALMSNVLRKNSSSEHLALATEVEKMMSAAG